MTPADLRAEADRADAEAERLEKAGRFAKATFDQQAKAQRDTAVEFRKLAEKLEARGTTSDLHSEAVKSRVNVKKMHEQHKLAISEGQAKRDKKFKEKIRAAKPGYTQASLAGALGMKASLLSMCRSGERAMFLSRAKRCEELTGWPADKAHWPGGIIEDA